MEIKAEIPAVSMRTFLPRAPDRYYRYNGSLTTPGCFESVIWTVFHEKQYISRRQVQKVSLNFTTVTNDYFMLAKLRTKHNYRTNLSKKKTSTRSTVV